MNDRETRRYDMFGRVKIFGQTNTADFVQSLKNDRTAIDSAQDSIEGDDEEGMASTDAVGRLIKGGMKEVNYLDAIRHNKYARDPDNLRAWQSASHIESAPQREKKPTPAPAPPQ